MESEYTNEDLMEHLRRLDTASNREVTANDVIRDEDAPAVTTYYKRFGNGWPDVMDVYHTWQETGDLPPTPEADEWWTLNRKLRGIE